MEKLAPDSFFSGLSGLQLPIPRYLFPPPFVNASRLTYYSSLFNSIEINSTFYKIPQATTVLKWATCVENEFKFTFKLWKEITHSKGFNFNASDVATYFKTIESIQKKKGCVLIQFPPGLGKNHIFELVKLLSCIRKIETDWKIAIEFRNNSWYNDTTYKLLNCYEVALVNHDIPKSATPKISLEADFMYFRFHGPTGNYRGSYSEEVLSEHANCIRYWLKAGKEVYAYFNNTMGDASNNLKSLNSFLNHNTGMTQEYQADEKKNKLKYK